MFFLHSMHLIAGIIIGLLGFSLLVGIHELGHFIFCKLFGIHTPSFSIGFGPKIVSKKIGDTLFSLSLIPFGGYVEIAGNEEIGQGEQKHSHQDDAASFKNKPLYQKILVMSGGIICNILLCWVILFFLFFKGAPPSPLLAPYTISTTVEKANASGTHIDSPLQDKDVIIAIDQTNVLNNYELFSSIIQASANKTVVLEIERNGTIIKQPVAVYLCPQTNKGFLDIAPATHSAPSLSIISSIIAASTMLPKLAILFFDSLKTLCAQRSLQGVGGPLMIMSIITQTAQKDFSLFLLFIAFISIQLAALNILPLPIFDGGQIMTLSIEKLIGRAIPEKISYFIQIGSWIAVLTLMIYLSYTDILRIFPALKNIF